MNVYFRVGNRILLVELWPLVQSVEIYVEEPNRLQHRMVLRPNLEKNHSKGGQCRRKNHGFVPWSQCSRTTHDNDDSNCFHRLELLSYKK